MAPRFLQQLELDTTADERAIRRAYAQKLKKIDQEANPAGFQALRAAYDAALMWARQPGRSAPEQDLAAEDQANAVASPAPAPSFAPPNVAVPKLRAEPTAPPPVAPAPVPAPAPQDEAVAQANATFVSFMDGFKAAAANPKTMPDYHTWQAALEKRMAGDALISMTARELFEYRFAALLTQGWKPGHEALLVAATNVFRWNEDRRHLQNFGNVGFVLDRALQERALFDRLPPKDRAQQRALIQRLRNPSEPSRRELQDSFVLLENTLRNFPTWLGIITDVSQLPRWRELYAALPPGKRGKQAPQRQSSGPSSSKQSSFSWWWVWLVLIVLINGARLLGNGPVPQSTVSHESSTAGGHDLLAQRSPSPTIAPPPASSTVGSAGANTIQCSDPQPVYPSMSQKMGEEGRATVKLFIGETGEITNVALTSSSGSPRLDNAATATARTVKCTPYRQHGQAVPVVASKSYVFKLDN